MITLSFLVSSSVHMNSFSWNVAIGKLEWKKGHDSPESLSSHLIFTF